MHFCDISNRAILRCKTFIFLLTFAACSAFFILETQIPGFTPGAIDIVPFQGMDKISPARMIFFSAASRRKFGGKRMYTTTKPKPHGGDIICL
jgi:hypothetical protein